MLTRKDIGRLLTSGLQTVFMKGRDSVVSIFPEFSTEIKSNKASEEYGWLGGVGGLKKWIDERTPRALRENGFSLKNKDYENTIEVDRNALEDDQYGQIKIRTQTMGAAAKQSYDKFAAEVVNNGHLSACYDGQNFFDTDHEEGESGVQLNYYDSGKALSATNLQLIMTNMRRFKSDDGELAGINPTHLMVPSILEWKAKEILDPAFVGVTTDPSKAVMKGLLKVIVNPYLTGADTDAAYYVMDLSGAVKPIIYQNRKDLEFTALDDPTSPEYFHRKKIFYGVDARFAFGYGDWRMMFKAKG